MVKSKAETILIVDDFSVVVDIVVVVVVADCNTCEVCRMRVIYLNQLLQLPSIN